MSDDESDREITLLTMIRFHHMAGGSISRLEAGLV